MTDVSAQAGSDPGSAEASPSVTVLMAVCNSSAYLREAIDSVLVQTFFSFEFLIVDDGSTDSTWAIIQTYTDPRIRTIRLDANVGLVAALNVGLENARASLIARMDGDDVCEPARLERQFAFMRDHDEVVACGCACTTINGRGEEIGVLEYPEDDSDLRAALLDYNPICHPSVMFRAGAVAGIGGYRDLGGRYAQDYDLFLRLSEVGRLANLPDKLLRYRYHSDQVTSAKLRLQVRAARIYRELAGQRRSGCAEDLNAVLHSSALAESSISKATCISYFKLARMKWRASETSACLALAARGIRECPLQVEPYQQAVGLVKLAIRQNRFARSARWYLSKLTR